MERTPIEYQEEINELLSLNTFLKQEMKMLVNLIKSMDSQWEYLKVKGTRTKTFEEYSLLQMILSGSFPKYK